MSASFFLVFFLIILSCKLIFASGVYNPTSSSNYIQNTLTPTINTQTFSVQQGSYSVAGFIMTDSANCQWNTTINTSGAITTTLIGCPSNVAYIPCVHGQPLGLLLGLTCGNP